MRALIIYCFLSFWHVTTAQQEFARSFVDVFASDEFHGRGYVNNGCEKAAKYLAEQYTRFGLQPIGNSYFQPFAIDVNTFPYALFFALDSVVLKEGEHYLVDPASGSSSGNFTPFLVDFYSLSALAQQPENTVFVIDLSITNNRDSLAILQRLKYQLAQSNPVVVVNSGKLTWSVAGQHTQHAIVELSKQHYFPSTSIRLDVKNKHISNYELNNVVGHIKGRKKKKYIVVTAHYDHLGKMGNATFNGANDNASGVASMLYIAQHFAKKKPKYSMVFIGFAAEEAGLVGSEYFVNHPLIPLKQIRFLINLDLNGTGDEGITVVNGTMHKKEFLKLTNINNKQLLLEKIKVRGQAANSDHYWFTQNGVPAFFIYTMGGVSHYHDIYDRPETLPLTEFNDLMSLLIQFIGSF